MNIDGQDIVVLCVVLGAMGYVVRHIRRKISARNPACCETCTRCPTVPEDQQLITIQPVRKARRQAES